jgi:hypothetical protein
MNQDRISEAELVGFNACDGMTVKVHSAQFTYDVATFAKDDPERFHELVNFLCPRDQETIILYAVLQKRPTDLSVLFGKAGHRAEEDLHKAAHKLAGLIEFGPQPQVTRIHDILVRHSLQSFGNHSLAACVLGYARSRNFAECESGLRQHMLRTFKKLHAAEGRESGLLAGWLLWLVDGSDPKGKGWRKRKRAGKLYKLGPTVFHASGLNPPADGRGGQGQLRHTVKITRKMEFVLRGMNA